MTGILTAGVTQLVRLAKWYWNNDDLIWSAVWIGLGVKVGLIDNTPGALFVFGLFGLNFFRVHRWKTKAKEAERQVRDQSTYIRMLHAQEPIGCNGVTCEFNRRSSNG